MRREDQPGKSNRDVTQPRLKPGQDWVCGYADIRQSCRTGPSCDGRCSRSMQTSTQVDLQAGSQTNARKDDTAADSDATSSAESLPCIPRRSLAVRRQSLRLNLAILTGGLLLLCLALPSRERTFVPGELSSKHAQILDNTVASQRCGLCHPASHADGPVSPESSSNHLVAGLLSSAKRLIENDGRQDQLCMQCHKSHLPAAGNRDPHDLSPKQWQRLQDSGKQPWQLVSVRKFDDSEASSAASGSVEASSTASKLDKTSCAMCHNEHHGRGFDIKLISDNRCQACHQRQFESLASGHPEFKNFPKDRPRGVAFSHGRHLQDHFPKKNRDFDCKACHVSASKTESGDLVARSLSFEHACASCHEQPIRAAVVDGWAAIQLPSLEAADVRVQAEFSQWPEAARYGYDGFISPVLRALLMADPEALKALEKLPASGKIVDISSIESARASVAKTLALATQRLIDDTARDGQRAWTSRLEKVTAQHLERELTDQDRALIAAMTVGLPPDLFRAVQSQWWHPQPSLVQNRTWPGRLASATTPQQDSSSLLDDSLLEASPNKPQTKASTPTDSAEDLLAPVANGQGDDLLLQTDEPKTQKPKMQMVKGATHLANGGWYADPSTLAIRYMGTGHADATLAAWSLWWSMLESHRSILPSGGAERIAQRLNLTSAATNSEIAQSIADTVPGKCTECHQLSQMSISKLVSQPGAFRLAAYYQVPERSPVAREFTKFQHTAHLTLPALSDCRYCHQEKDRTATLTTTAIKHHPTGSEFSSMTVSQCSACHRPGGANDRCVQCHNYHVTGSALR